MSGMWGRVRKGRCTCRQGVWRAGKGLWLASERICEWWPWEPVWAEARQCHLRIPKDQRLPGSRRNITRSSGESDE